MALPANFNRIIYKFRPPKLNSESEFNRIKTSDSGIYNRNIRHKIIKEIVIYVRHHRIRLITCIVSTIATLFISFYLIFSGNLSLFSISNQGLAAYLWSILFILSLLTIMNHLFCGYISSLISFIKYIKAKLSFFRILKSRIDGCEDYSSYKSNSLGN